MIDKSAHPLCWPERRPRFNPRKVNHHFKSSFARARDNCIQEVTRIGGDRLIISSNLKLKPDGKPYAADDGKILPDPGVAVYFTRNGKELCFACDCWSHVQDNMHAIALTIEALRGIARWGTGYMMEAAFRGFAALPETTGSNWWEVLGVPVNSAPDQVKEAYRLLAKKFHPDTGENGGDAERFRRVQQAWEQFETLTRKAA